MMVGEVVADDETVPPPHDVNKRARVTVNPPAAPFSIRPIAVAPGGHGMPRIASLGETRGLKLNCGTVVSGMVPLCCKRPQNNRSADYPLEC
jgi:hypothetical protein